MNNLTRDISTEEISLFKDMLCKLNLKTKTKGIQKLRCAIYARKSTKDEKETSLDAQISHCRDLISKSSFLEEVHVFQEDDVSGMSTDKRTEFKRMFELVEKRAIDVIVCMAWDRFARKLADSQRYTEIAFRNDVYVLTGDNALFVKDAASNFARTLYQATSELFARQGAEKTINSLLTQAKKGKYVSGQAPFGYRKNGLNKLEMNFNEATIVSKIYSLIQARKNLYFCCERA